MHMFCRYHRMQRAVSSLHYGYNTADLFSSYGSENIFQHMLHYLHHACSQKFVDGEKRGDIVGHHKTMLIKT